MQNTGVPALFLRAMLAGGLLSAPMAMAQTYAPAVPWDSTEASPTPAESTPAPQPVNLEAFTISNVPVDVTAENAAAAREKAIFSGQRTALTQLLERMDAAKAIDPAKLSDNKIAALVRNFEITSEKTSSVRYIANMNVRFKPRAVQSLLGNAGVSFTANPTMPQLILPLAMSGGRSVLWEEQTPWHQALASLERPDALQPIIIPNGDLQDVGAIDANNASAGDAASLGAIATLHNAGSVVVAQIGEDPADSAQKNLNLTVTRYDNTGQKLETQTIAVPAAKDRTAQLAVAAQQVKSFLQHKPMVDVLAPGYAPSSLAIHAALTSLPELTRLRQRLAGIPAIKRINIRSIRRDGVDMALDFNGDQMQLQQALSQQGLLLTQAPGGSWQLQSAQP